MDLYCHLQSLVKGIVSIVLKIAAVCCQWLKVDPRGQGGKLFFRKSQAKNIGFHEESRGGFVLSS